MDEVTTSTMLDDEIKEQLANLSTLKPGTDEHTDATRALKELYTLKNEEAKLVLEYAKNGANLEEQKTERKWKYGVMVGLAALGYIVNTAWMNRGYNEERDLIVGSPTFKDYLNKRKTFPPKY